MKTLAYRGIRPLWGLALVLLLALAPGSVQARESRPAPDSSEVCPLTANDIKASLPYKALKARTGQAAMIRVDLDPPKAPAGFYYSAIVDVLRAPAGAEPEILSGVPEIRVTASQAGDYLFRIRVTLIAKSSCAGAKASILLEDVVRLTVS